MTSLLNFHTLAAARGDGLRPELRTGLERGAAAPCAELRVRDDGMIQSGPDPAEAIKESGDLSLVARASVRQKGNANQNPATPARPLSLV